MPPKRRRGRRFQTMRKTGPASCDNCQARYTTHHATCPDRPRPAPKPKTEPAPTLFDDLGAKP